MTSGDKYLRKCESKYAVVDEVKEDANIVFFNCFELMNDRRLYTDYLTIEAFREYYPHKLGDSSFHQQKRKLKI